jgi:hypothetical protein
MDPLEADVPQIDFVDFGDVIRTVQLFDDTTEEFLNGVLKVHPDVDTSGTVTFRAEVYAKTAASSKNVAVRFGHLAKADGEAIDGSYTSEDADDQSIDATQNDATFIVWTETLANLGWQANDLVHFRFSRFAATTNNLSGDMGILKLTVQLPLT